MADEETPQAEEQPKEERAVARAGAGGRQVAAAGAGGPAVVVVPTPPAGFAPPKISRRRALQVAFWTGLLSTLGAIGYTFLNNFYPRGVTGFGGPVFVGTVDSLQPGSFIRSLEAKAWVMRLNAAQASREGAPEGSIIALWHVCPHLGCTVPWRPEFTWTDSRSGESYPGWFRCPCHGSTYSVTGFRVFGPAPRSMDTFEITLDGGNIVVNTSNITQGGTQPEDNPSRAVLPS
jgi:cytochrome b6-f complex iron-sulfur subunit